MKASGAHGNAASGWARAFGSALASVVWDKKSRVCGTGDSVPHEAQLERNGGKVEDKQWKEMEEMLKINSARGENEAN